MSTDLCSVIGGNTGGIDCDQRRGVPVSIIIGGGEFTSSQYADSDTLQDALIAKTLLPTGDSNKLFAFPVINQIAVNTEADTTGSLAQGPVVRLRKGRPSFTYTLQDIGQYQFQKLLAFDNKTVPVFTFDDGSLLWGYRATGAANTVNNNNFKGERALITIGGNGFKDGQNVETGQMTVTVSYLSADDFEKRGTFASLPDLSSGDVAGLVDVTLVEPVAHTTNVYKVRPVIQLPKLSGDLNIFDEYGAALAALSAQWSAYTGATFSTPITITSIAVDNTLKALTVTFDSTAFTALASGAKIKLVPPTATQLDAGDIPGYEIGIIILTK